MTWRVAKSLLKLRSQIDAAHPSRRKGNDGTIGDERHASRSSDHNPWVIDNGEGVVTAIDITHDPGHGVDTYQLAEHLRQTRDIRIKYVISNGKIFSSQVNSWEWRVYHGSSPHDEHVHVSVRPLKSLYDLKIPWALGALDPSSNIHPTPTTNRVVQYNITATVFGGADDRELSAYTNQRLMEGYYIALPYYFHGTRPRVLVTNSKTGKAAIGNIEDVGPWNANDPYWSKPNGRPQAESGKDSRGRKTNSSGIDLSPDLAKFLGIEGKGKVDWSFE